MIEASISLGSILSIAATLIASLGIGIGFVWAIKSSVGILDVRLGVQDQIIKEIKDEMKVLARVVTDIALQSQRMTVMEDRMLLQGKRLDDTVGRINRWLDDRVKP